MNEPIRPISSEPHEPALCCICGDPLIDAEIEAGYCEDCVDGSTDLEDLLDKAFEAADRKPAR